eukprot:gene20875-22927_t
MADNDFSSTVKHAFVKIESKRRRERRSTDRYIERRASLQTCCDEQGFKTAAADMLNSRQRLRKSKPDRHRDTEYMDDDQSLSSNLIDDKIKLANKDKKEETEENEEEDDAMQDFVSIGSEVAAKRSISLVASYVYELKSFEGISPVNPNCTAFCILDIDTDKHPLNERKFVVVTRKAIRFGGNTWKWPLGFQKLQNPYHHCLAAVEVLTEFDSVNDLYPSSYIDAEGNARFEMLC